MCVCVCHNTHTDTLWGGGRGGVGVCGLACCVLDPVSFTPLTLSSFLLVDMSAVAVSVTTDV